MRPYPEELLRALQGGIATHLAPELQSNYAKAQFGFAMLLFNIATRDYDTAVPDLIEANRTLRSLLNEAMQALAVIATEGAAEARAAAALPPAADSLRLAALRAEHDDLRAVLSKLAPLIEAAGDDDALAPLRESRTAIYAYLAADAKKRIVPILSA